MKPFTLFFGASGVLGTHNVTANPKYQLVVETVSQLRAHLLNDRAFRVPILSLFNSVYEDDSQFPEELKENTPDIDQISNMKKIRQIHSHPPSDNDVLEFLTNSFPDLYLDLGNFSLAELVLWGETKSGRGEVAKEEITINVHLVQLWLEAASTQTAITAMELSFMFVAVFLHELAHSSLVWYGAGSCDSPRLNGINSEAGVYMEKAIFGAISLCEISTDNLQIKKVGLEKGGVFYPISWTQASKLMKLDTSNGLPLITPADLSPAPPSTLARFRAKLLISRFKAGFSEDRVPLPINTSGVMYSHVQRDKIRVLPTV